MRQPVLPLTVYDPAFYQRLIEVEDHHFWFQHRNRVIAALVGQVTSGLQPGYRVLEVGCGTGNVLRALAAACPGGIVVGMDLFDDGLRFARKRLPDALLVRGDAMRPPFAVRFDVIGMFDVLEHLANDVDALRSMRDVAATNGALVITVPAGPALWSYWDQASMHVRRYEADELTEKLSQAGFEVEFLSPYMGILYPVLWLGRRVAAGRHFGRSGEPGTRSALIDQELRVNPLVRTALGPFLELERRRIRRRRRLPMGASLVAIARVVD